MLQKFMTTTLPISIKSNNVHVLTIKFNHLHNDSIEYKFKDSLRTIPFNNTKDSMSNKRNKRLRFNQEVNQFKCKVHRQYS